MVENNEQELTRQFMLFEQKTRLLHEQLQAIEQGIYDLNKINEGLDELIGKTGSEIISSIGRGIYTQTKLSSEELIFDIGGGNFVKKNIPEAKKTITEQVKKLGEIREELNKEMESINEELTKVFLESQKKINN